jgi:hypothetical protein
MKSPPSVQLVTCAMYIGRNPSPAKQSISRHMETDCGYLRRIKECNARFLLLQAYFGGSLAQAVIMPVVAVSPERVRKRAC